MPKVVQTDVLHAFAAETFQAAGVPAAEANRLAEHVVEADRRGISSHGVMRLPVYTQRMRKGLVNLTAQPVVVHESHAAALMDAQNGLSIIAADEAMKLAVEKATQHGIGMVGVRNSGHCGFLAYFTGKAAEAGCIGIACTNAPPAMAPWGGREPYFGTNPFSVAVPRRNAPPIVLDMATSMAARARIRIAGKKGEQIPLGWAIDKEGRPTTDPAAALEGLILPVGGAKGYGLALMVDVLAGILNGGPFGPALGFLTDERPQGTGHTMIAMRADLFVPMERFLDQVEEMAAQLKACPPMAGYDGVLLPGEPEVLCRERTERQGVTLSDGVAGELAQLAAELTVAVPWA